MHQLLKSIDFMMNVPLPKIVPIYYRAKEAENKIFSII